VTARIGFALFSRALRGVWLYAIGSGDATHARCASNVLWAVIAMCLICMAFRALAQMIMLPECT
jgi:hypothetical protein